MIKYLFMAVTALLVSSGAAEARHHHRHASVSPRYTIADPGCNIFMPCEGVSVSPRGVRAVRAMGGFGAATQRYVHTSRLERGVRTYRTASFDSGVSTQIVSHPTGCPRSAFCGCGTAVHLLGSPVRSLWLAANWGRFPRAMPAPGMAAYRRGHVFAIERVLGNGMVVAYDPNSGGHATRVHVVSLRGFTVVNPHL